MFWSPLSDSYVVVLTRFQTQEGNTEVLFLVPGTKSSQGILKLDCISINSQLERRQGCYLLAQKSSDYVPDTMLTLHILSFHFSDKKLRYKEVNLFEVTILSDVEIQAQVYKTLHFLISSPHSLSAKRMILNVIQTLKTGNKSYYHSLHSMTTGLKFTWKM